MSLATDGRRTMSNEARKSVWAVESGSYSDYRVNAVFSTEARAQAFA